MPYRPGDNWIICDLTGKKVLMSQSRKTWDGLRVWDKVWYPRHPQLDVRAIPDRMAVYDGRPRQVDVYNIAAYGTGNICLISPDETRYILTVDDDGAVIVLPGSGGIPSTVVYIGRHELTVDNDRAVHVAYNGALNGPSTWIVVSGTGKAFYLTVSADLSMLITPAV